MHTCLGTLHQRHDGGSVAACAPHGQPSLDHLCSRGFTLSLAEKEYVCSLLPRLRQEWAHWEKKVECGFASLEARVDAKKRLREWSSLHWEVGMDRMMLKFNEMNVEDKHTINNYEPLHTLVGKLDLDMVALKEREEGSAASTAVTSSRSGGIGGFNSEPSSRGGYGGSSSTWIPTR